MADTESSGRSIPISTYLRRLRPYPLKQRRWFVGIVFLSGLSGLIAVLQPLPLKLLIDSGLGDQPPPAPVEDVLATLGVQPTNAALVVLAALAGFALILLARLVDSILDWSWEVAGQHMVYDLAGDLFAHLQALSPGFHRRRAVGDLLDRLSVDTWAIYTASSAVLVTPITAIFTLVTVGWVAWQLNPRLAAIVFIAGATLPVVARALGDRIRQRSVASRESEARQAALAHQILEATPLVQANVAEDRTRALFDTLSDQIVRSKRDAARARTAYDSTGGMIRTLGSAAVLVLGGLQVLDGSLTVGSLLVFLAYLSTLGNAAQQLLGVHAELRSASASLHRVVEVLEVVDEVRDPVRPMIVPPAWRFGRVVLDGVGVEYEPGRLVLSDVSVAAAPGQTVALVGSTGAGKTTLVSLIPRFLDPVAGQVLIDGVDVRRFRLAELRQQVALVRQEPLLLPVSVADNIAYGRPGANHDAIEAAATAANADAFIRALPHGYDTVLGERGATLSGGQRQRIAIARALLKDAPILILDEPTSALDADTEAHLLDALQHLMRGRTTFLITHRISALRHVDHIVVLEQGRVVEQGSHSQLLAAGGRYHHYHTLHTTPTPAGAA